MPGDAPERKSNDGRNIVPPLKLMPPDKRPSRAIHEATEVSVVSR